MKKDFVVMGNDLIRASYKLTVNEIRLIFVALTKLPKDRPVELFEPFYVTKEDFVRLGADPNNVARDIRAGSDELLGKHVVIDSPIEPMKMTWISSVLHFKSDTFERLKKELNVPDDRMEFQMLYGVKEDLRDKLVKEGHKVRIYVPFGKDWYKYSIRRLQENPNVAGQIFTNLFKFGK